MTFAIWYDVFILQRLYYIIYLYNLSHTVDFEFRDIATPTVKRSLILSKFNLRYFKVKFQQDKKRGFELRPHVTLRLLTSPNCGSGSKRCERRRFLTWSCTQRSDSDTRSTIWRNWSKNALRITLIFNRRGGCSRCVTCCVATHA